MADVKKFLDLAGLQVNNDLLKGVISEEDAKILEEAKSYADGKDEAIAEAKKAGEDAQSAVEALESGAVADNASAIEAINNADTGILAQAKEYADGKDEAIEAAKKSGDDAQSAVDALAETVETTTSDISTMKGQIEALESGTYDDSEVRGLISDNADAITEMDETKADKATTLEGYGITDAYTKEEVDEITEDVKVTISTATTTEVYLKSYTIKQGEAELGVIDIPKDLVVTSGEVVVNPDGQAEGTYIKLTIANQETPIYVNVKDLVDAYTAQAGATQIQLAISDTNEISATIVAGSVGTTELADKGVTAAKLADDVKLLFDAANSATNAETNAKKHADDLNTAMDERVGALEEAMGDGFDSISTAEIEALFA